MVAMDIGRIRTVSESAIVALTADCICGADRTSPSHVVNVVRSRLGAFHSNTDPHSPRHDVKFRTDNDSVTRTNSIVNRTYV